MARRAVEDTPTQEALVIQSMEHFEEPAPEERGDVAAHVPAVALSMEHIAQEMVAKEKMTKEKAQTCQLGAPARLTQHPPTLGQTPLQASLVSGPPEGGPADIYDPAAIMQTSIMLNRAGNGVKHEFRLEAEPMRLRWHLQCFSLHERH
jgi:hypothetical protein